jgi:beta-xylosidase
MKQKEKTALTKMQKEFNRKSGLTDTQIKYVKASEFPKKTIDKIKIKTGRRVK